MKVQKKLSTKQSTVLIVVAVMAGIVGFGVMMFAQSSSNDPQGAVKQSQCEGICVALREDKADPDTLTVALGSYVQFNSADGKSHNLSLGKGGEEHSHKGKFHSDEFQADEAWKVQFNEEGSFFFHDHLNPKINILVVVYTPGKDYKIQ